MAIMANPTSSLTTKFPPSESFRRALTAFRNRLEPHELVLFQQTSLDDLENSLDTVQQRQEVQKNLLGTTRLKGYLEATEQLGKIVEVFLNVSDAVAFVWGPIKLVLQTASTWSHAFDQLLDAYQSLGEQFPLIRQYESLFGTDHKMHHVLELLYCDILEFHRRALPFLRKKIWKQVFRSMWNDFTGRFNEIIASVKRHTRMLEAQANLIHFENDIYSRNATSLLLQRLEEEQRSVLEKFEQLENDRKDANFRTVQQWIGATTTKGRHQDACERWSRYAGTGQWILREKQISCWMNDDIPKDSILWLHGIPGAGKTVLTSIIIDRCQKIEDAIVVYAYCRFDDEQTTKCLAILKCLLAQIIVLCPELTPYFLEKCRDSREAILTDDKIAKDLFEPACYSSKRMYVILDGLDECSRADRRMILSFLTSLVRKIDTNEPGKLRVLVTSQSETDIARSLPSADFFKLLPEHNEEDIAKFVSVEALTIKQKFGLSDEEKDFIERQIKHRAAGQFVYARLVLENLFCQASLDDLVYEIHLSRFPKELTEAYQRILERIQRYSQPSEWRYVHKILGWMVQAARPMKWNEMQTALSIDVVGGFVDFNGKSLRFDIKDVCGSLISIDEYGRTTLIHSTAKTFISESGQVIPELVELDLTALCLQYLSLPCFDADLSDHDFEAHVQSGQFAFQDYALAKWEHHFRQATRLLPKLLQKIEQPKYEYALQVLSEAISEFVLNYQDDMLKPQEAMNEEDKRMTTALEIWKEFGVFENAIQIYNHGKAHRTTSQTAFNDISLSRLRAACERSRATIEHLSETNGSADNPESDLTRFYGSDRFKCLKLTCYYFHQGYANGKARQRHIDRHKKPYQCPVLDCGALEFGFVDKNNLDRHLRSFHSELEDTTKTFPTRKLPNSENWKHPCPTCQKKFSRSGILKDHLLTHEGHKPHQCKRCGKAFTRKNDRDRHERTIHAQRARLEKSFP